MILHHYRSTVEWFHCGEYCLTSIHNAWRIYLWIRCERTLWSYVWWHTACSKTYPTTIMYHPFLITKNRSNQEILITTSELHSNVGKTFILFFCSAICVQVDWRIDASINHAWVWCYCKFVIRNLWSATDENLQMRLFGTHFDANFQIHVECNSSIQIF